MSDELKWFRGQGGTRGSQERPRYFALERRASDALERSGKAAKALSGRAKYRSKNSPLCLGSSGKRVGFKSVDWMRSTEKNAGIMELARLMSWDRNSWGEQLLPEVAFSLDPRVCSGSFQCREVLFLPTSFPEEAKSFPQLNARTSARVTPFLSTNPSKKS